MSPQESNEVRVEVDGRTLKLSNLDKVLYPRSGTTKGEVLNYYAQVSPAMLPLLANRCATRVRWPNGVEKQSFFEKNIPNGTPSWVRTAEVPTTGSRAPSRNGDVLVFPVVDDLATLTWLANLAALELHVHQWTVTKRGKVQNPNRLVVDLDPGEPAGLGECSQVALLVRGDTVGYYNTVSASFGFQLGVQERSIIIMFMTQDALDRFSRTSGWKVGVDGSVTIIAVGVGGSIDTDKITSPVIGFVLDQKGLMYNLTLEGSKISRIER